MGSGFIAAIGRLNVSEAIKNIFEAGSLLLGCNGLYATVRDRSSEVDEVILIPCYSVLEHLSDFIFDNFLHGLRGE